METVDRTSLIQKMVDGLRAAAIELEELQLDIALGKAEAADKYHEARQQLRNAILHAKGWLREEKTEVSVLMQELLDRISERSGPLKGDPEQEINELKPILSRLQQSVKEKGSEIFSPDKLGHEFEKFKLKLELIPIQFELMKMGLADEAAELRKRIQIKFGEIERKISVKFREEKHELKEVMTEAYDELKSIFLRD